MDKQLNLDLERLGNAIKTRRLSLGLSQEKFSDLAGIHRTYVSQIELGQRNPTYTTLTRIAKALKYPLTKLVEDAKRD